MTRRGLSLLPYRIIHGILKITFLRGLVITVDILGFGITWRCISCLECCLNPRLECAPLRSIVLINVRELELPDQLKAVAVFGVFRVHIERVIDGLLGVKGTKKLLNYLVCLAIDNVVDPTRCSSLQMVEYLYIPVSIQAKSRSFTFKGDINALRSLFTA